ncbi:MAG: TIM barrel protein [Clostridiales bacterium]|nr:TIM barrel protein [Clostridiales bacterium]
MNQVLCSTGALLGRANGRDPKLLEGFAKQLECDGFEFMIYEYWYPELDSIVDHVKSLSLNIPVVHCEKNVGEMLAMQASKEAMHRFDLNCRAAERLGVDKMVLHLWNGMLSDKCIESNFKSLVWVRERAEASGIEVLVENVVCNQKDPQTHIDTLARETDVRFTFDTKMAAFHGQVDEIFAPERQQLWSDGRIAHIHVNDYAGKPKEWKKLATLHLGTGHIDFDNFFMNIKKRNYKGDFTVEATSFDASGNVDIAALNRDFAKIYEHIK